MIFTASKIPSLIILHSRKPIPQYIIKNAKFHPEWNTIANHPFPLDHVLKLKNMWGTENKNPPYASVSIDTTPVLNKWAADQTTPDPNMIKGFPER